jgi:hypothetical protein
VVGAAVDLGACLDLCATSAVDLRRAAYATFAALAIAADRPIPSNGRSLLLRRLDCAVIETLHRVRRDAGDQPVDTVRGVFVEGEPIYPGAGIVEKTHVRIAVRNPDCIKGVFRVAPP